MRETRTKIVRDPDDLSADDLKLNYALLALSLSKLMTQTGQPTVKISINDKDDGDDMGLSVNWDADAGVCTICQIPWDHN